MRKLSGVIGIGVRQVHRQGFQGVLLTTFTDHSLYQLASRCHMFWLIFFQL